jgi:hypothetical protein
MDRSSTGLLVVVMVVVLMWAPPPHAAASCPARRAARSVADAELVRPIGRAERPDSNPGQVAGGDPEQPQVGRNGRIVRSPRRRPGSLIRVIIRAAL